jgi:tripartite ATP-independent transporter DctP family solute receptor
MQLTGLSTILRTSLAAILLCTACGGESSVTTLKLAHVLDAMHPVTRAIAYFGEELEKISGGQMKVDIYIGGQLGGERELVESLQIGSLDITKVSCSVVENFVPEVAVFSLPYLFRNDDHRWNVLDSSIGHGLLDACTPFQIKGLCYYDAGTRNFYLRDTAVKSPADLDGLKIRVMRSYWSIQAINALGASATPVEFGELYTALQQGVVDGAENNLPTFYQSKHFEVCKYMVLDAHTAPPDIMLISTYTWNRLTPQQQGWLMEAIDKSVEYQKVIWQESWDDALQKVQEGGVTVIEPEMDAFRAQVSDLYKGLEGGSLWNLITQIRETP